MLYVANGKTYLATFDESLKVYPEVAVAAGESGGYSITLKGGGVKTKPKNRRVCTVEEYLAQTHGGVATVVEPDEGEDDKDEGPKLPTQNKSK